MEWTPASNEAAAWNIYGPGADEILWRYVAGVGHLRYHLDRMNNVRFITDVNGNPLEKYTYDPFGYPTVVSWTGSAWSTVTRTGSYYGNRFMFTGREFFAEMGIRDFRHRWYHPALGRFLQPDPTGFDAGDLNLFRYCGGDPVNHNDPTGEQPPVEVDSIPDPIEPNPGSIYRPPRPTDGPADPSQMRNPFGTIPDETGGYTYGPQIREIIDWFLQQVGAEPTPLPNNAPVRVWDSQPGYYAPDEEYTDGHDGLLPAFVPSRYRGDVPTDGVGANITFLTVVSHPQPAPQPALTYQGHDIGTGPSSLGGWGPGGMFTANGLVPGGWGNMSFAVGGGGRITDMILGQ